MSDFKTRLKEARRYMGLSQAGLGERANMPASSIANFESGSREPSLGSFKRLAKALAHTTDYLLFGTPEDNTFIKAKAYQAISDIVNDFNKNWNAEFEKFKKEKP